MVLPALHCTSPAAGEMVLFDRSWYNRAGVERVMGFCTDDEYEEFFRSVPEFEKMLVRSGIQVIKYWFSITDEEQHSRFLARIYDPLKQWKLSPMDLESRRRWKECTRAKEVMLERTHIPESPWWVVHAARQEGGAPRTASHTCWIRLRTRRWSTNRSRCRNAYARVTTRVIRFPTKSWFRSVIEDETYGARRLVSYPNFIVLKR